MKENEMHSVHVDIWANLKAAQGWKPLAENAAQEFAEVRDDMDKLDEDARVLFQRYERVRADLDAVGVLAQMKLTPILEAAFGAWLRDRETPTRLAVAEIQEAPIPPEGT